MNEILAVIATIWIFALLLIQTIILLKIKKLYTEIKENLKK